MLLFFFLSGYVLKESRLQEALQKNIKHYAQRLLIPYFVFSLLTYIPWVFATRIYGADAKLNINPYRPLVGTIYGIGIDGWLQHNAMLWFLPCLFIVHLSFQSVAKVCSQDIRVPVSIILAAIGFWLSNVLAFRVPWGGGICTYGDAFL
jgi:acyltransferase